MIDDCDYNNLLPIHNLCIFLLCIDYTIHKHCDYKLAHIDIIYYNLERHYIRILANIACIVGCF